ncbi:MAG: rhomboid family intramembrane serine protease [Myxococcales bacterium]|nr:rhomboid family intramembrane serine protease [Myxococcales bacterium]
MSNMPLHGGTHFLTQADHAFQNVQQWLTSTRSGWAHRVPLSSCFPGLTDSWVQSDFGFRGRVPWNVVAPWLVTPAIADLTAAQVATALEAELRKFPLLRHSLMHIHLVLICDGRVSPTPPPGVFDFQIVNKTKFIGVCSAFDVATGQFAFVGEHQKKSADELLPILRMGHGQALNLSQFGPLVNATPTRPVAAKWLMGLMMAIMVAQFAFRVDTSTGLNLSVEDLISMGGNLPPKTRGGEPWRLATAALLHSGVMHLALNLFCIWVAGRSLERLLGRLWFLAAFAFTALAGSAASMAFGSDNVVSIGASGGALGLMGLGAVVALRLRSWNGRNLLLLQSLQILIPSLFLMRAPDGSAVDVAAHVGGALSGVALGLLLRLKPVWPHDATMPRAKGLALAFAAIFGALAIWGALSVVLAWPEETVRIQTALQNRERTQLWTSRLMPDNRGPAVGETWDDVADEYPQDPRVLVALSERFYLQGDAQAAIEMLEPAWTDIDVVRPLFSAPTMGDAIALNMALYYDLAGRTADSQAAASIACASTDPQIIAITGQNAMCAPTP